MQTLTHMLLRPLKQFRTIVDWGPLHNSFFFGGGNVFFLISVKRASLPIQHYRHHNIASKIERTVQNISRLVPTILLLILAVFGRESQTAHSALICPHVAEFFQKT